MHSMAGRVLFTLINAVTGMLTARALHPVGRGELSALGVWPNFLGGLMTLGLPSALVYWTRTQPERQRDLIWASLPLTLISGVLAIIIGIIGIPFWLAQYNPHVIFIAQVFMLNAFVVLLTANARAICEAEGAFLASSIALCLTPSFTVLALGILIGVGRLTPINAAATYIVSGIPALCYLSYQLRHNFRHRWQNLRGAVLQLLTYGLRSYGVDICGTLALYADQAIVIHALTPEDMGTYVVALSLSRTLGVIHQTVASVLFPKAVAREPNELIEMTGRAVRVSTCLTLVVALSVAVCGPTLLGLLYGKEYRSATAILDILILEAVLTGMALVLTRAFMALGRPGTVTLLQASGLVLSIPLLGLLVPRWGLVGASIALLVAAFVRLLLSLLSFRSVLGVKAPNILPRPRETYVLCVHYLQQSWSGIQRRRLLRGV